MTRSYDDPQPGRCRVRVDARSLAEYLCLPEGMRVLAVIQSQDPVSLDVIVESDALPEVPPYAESPVAPILWTKTENEHDTPVMRFEIQWPEGSAL